MSFKEHPLLFSTPMVESTLRDLKTMTRRLNGLEMINEKPDLIDVVQVHTREGIPGLFATFDSSRLTDKDFDYLQEKYNHKSFTVKFPYGTIGDLLWVRENLFQEGELGLRYVAYNDVIDESIIPNDYGPYGGEYSFRNIPNIHMPKWAARIWLKITNVRVERLQSITESDSKAEGIKREGDSYYFYPCNDYRDDSYIPTGYPIGNLAKPSAAQVSFMSLWASINGWESWNKNPWVWVLTFEVISTDGRPKATEV